MSLLLALVGVEPVVVGRRFKKYAKGYVRKGHKVLVFETEELAREYLEAEEQAKKAIKKVIGKPIIKPKPVNTVSIPKVEAQARSFGIEFKPEQESHIDYERLYKTWQRLIELQDEEDIELLLLA